MAFALPGRRAISVIFDNLPSAISLHFSPFRLQETFGFFQMCILRINTAYLCPNIIHFDERRSEEGMSFF